MRVNRGLCDQRWSFRRNHPLRQYVLDHFAVVEFEALAAGHFQFVRIETKLVEHGSVNIRDVMAIFDRVKTQLVGKPVNHAPLDPAAREPRAETLRMMIAACALGAG